MRPEHEHQHPVSVGQVGPAPSLSTTSSSPHQQVVRMAVARWHRGDEPLGLGVVSPGHRTRRHRTDSPTPGGVAAPSGASGHATPARSSRPLAGSGTARCRPRGQRPTLACPMCVRCDFTSRGRSARPPARGRGPRTRGGPGATDRESRRMRGLPYRPADRQRRAGARALPITLGHQAVGRVVEHRQRVTEGWAIGDRVGAYWLAHTCGRCRFCRSGRENLCAQASSPAGIARRVRRVHGASRRGVAVPLPLDGRHPGRPAAVRRRDRLSRAASRSGVAPGDRVGLFGFGALGAVRHSGRAPLGL